MFGHHQRRSGITSAVPDPRAARDHRMLSQSLLRELQGNLVSDSVREFSFGQCFTGEEHDL